MDNVKFLIELTVQEVVGYIVTEENVEYDKAIDLFYTSSVFEKLSDTETGLYRESSAYIYELYKNERNTGKITPTDIWNVAATEKTP